MKTTAKRIRLPKAYIGTGLSPATAKLLGEIDRFLAKGDEDARQLWVVLSAFRGPDAAIPAYPVKDVLKSRTTEIIRTRALPHTAKMMREHADGEKKWIGADFARPTDAEGTLPLVARASDYTHFMGHINSAANLLGLARDAYPV